MDLERFTADESSYSELEDSILEADEVWARVGDTRYEEVESFSDEWISMAGSQASEVLKNEGDFAGIYDREVYLMETGDGEEYAIKCLNS